MESMFKWTSSESVQVFQSPFLSLDWWFNHKPSVLRNHHYYLFFLEIGGSLLFPEHFKTHPNNSHEYYDLHHNIHPHLVGLGYPGFPWIPRNNWIPQNHFLLSGHHTILLPSVVFNSQSVEFLQPLLSNRIQLAYVYIRRF